MLNLFLKLASPFGLGASDGHARSQVWDRSNWSPRVPWPWSRGVDGERLGDFVMGRKISGRWQYRNMTDDEARDWRDAVQSY
jgi:hypothetical protein